MYRSSYEKKKSNSVRNACSPPSLHPERPPANRILYTLPTESNEVVYKQETDKEWTFKISYNFKGCRRRYEEQ